MPIMAVSIDYFDTTGPIYPKQNIKYFSWQDHTFVIPLVSEVVNSARYSNLNINSKDIEV